MESQIDGKIQQSLQSNLKDTVSALVQEEVSQSLHEAKLVEERRRNIMVFNCEETHASSKEERITKDAEAFSKICQEVGSPDIIPEKLLRVGPIGDKPRALKAVLHTQAEKIELLRKSKNLQDSETLSDVIIAPDLTPSQQKARKQLVAELRRRKDAGETDIIIKNNKIIKKTTATTPHSHSNAASVEGSSVPTPPVVQPEQQVFHQ